MIFETERNISRKCDNSGTTENFQERQKECSIYVIFIYTLSVVGHFLEYFKFKFNVVGNIIKTLISSIKPLI